MFSLKIITLLHKSNKKYVVYIKFILLLVKYLQKIQKNVKLKNQ